ncbi:MAG: hypothetical protein MPW16_12550 [Candidatus Manganitrophus sp.]|nr:MAG: hypothetical protein MPW16_12550 [Candidatus Manganitrophus sp.]
MRRFRLLEPEDEESEEGEGRPGRSMKEWLKLLIWTLIWGGGTIWLTIAIMKVFKDKAKYF